MKLFLLTTLAVGVTLAVPDSDNLCKLCICEKTDGANTYKVDCQSRRLTTMPEPKNFPAPVTHLNLRFNRIEKIEDIGPFTELESLSLSTNLLKSIRPSAFMELKNLRYLDLSYNPLKTLHDDQFDNLGKLSSLNLSNCRFERFPDGLFKNQTNLVELNIGHNSLLTVKKKLFEPLNHLDLLTMDDNNIYSLPTDIFESTPELRTVDLSKNKFVQVPTEALRSARFLRELDLSENPIQVLNQASFYHLRSLRSLTLNKLDSLIEIHPNTFSTQEYLEDLSIENCALLMYIDANAFHGMFNRTWIAIKNVSFRRNRLATLSQKTLPFCNLTSLDLRENPWTCDCHLHWVSYCLETHHIKPNIECAAPKNLRSHFLDTIDPKNMVCEPTEDLKQLSTNAFMFYLTFFMMCCVFVLAVLIFRYRETRTDDKHSSIYYVQANSGNA